MLFFFLKTKLTSFVQNKNINSNTIFSNTLKLFKRSTAMDIQTPAIYILHPTSIQISSRLKVKIIARDIWARFILLCIASHDLG
jgi:hypothetical protein